MRTTICLTFRVPPVNHRLPPHSFSRLVPLSSARPHLTTVVGVEARGRRKGLEHRHVIVRCLPTDGGTELPQATTAGEVVCQGGLDDNLARLQYFRTDSHD